MQNDTNSAIPYYHSVEIIFAKEMSTRNLNTKKRNYSFQNPFSRRLHETGNKIQW